MMFFQRNDISGKSIEGLVDYNSTMQDQPKNQPQVTMETLLQEIILMNHTIASQQKTIASQQETIALQNELIRDQFYEFKGRAIKHNRVHRPPLDQSNIQIILRVERKVPIDLNLNKGKLKRPTIIGTNKR